MVTVTVADNDDNGDNNGTVSYEVCSFHIKELTAVDWHIGSPKLLIV